MEESGSVASGHGLKMAAESIHPGRDIGQIEEGFEMESGETFRAVFYGLGSDGTVGANKESIKMIGLVSRGFLLMRVATVRPSVLGMRMAMPWIPLGRPTRRGLQPQP